ncbi:MAG: twin-arginine translocation signal protein [Segetibacter sp.]|nr:twin-arginine translocation signal protein [Segetibacter sp.]
MDNKKQKSPRRKFLGDIAAGAAAIGMLSIPSSIKAASSIPDQPGTADEWFNTIKGKHRVVFDATRPHDLMPFAWPRVFLLTNMATGTTEKDNSVVVVLRHDAIPYAFEDRIWSKYKFGELFKADDPATKVASVRNPFWKPKTGDFKMPGFGNVAIGINELQDSGVMFAVCDAAMTVYSAAVAEGMKMDAATVKKDWVSGLLPGVQVVPSGVWALGRAQEHGCSYIFAG